MVSPAASNNAFDALHINTVFNVKNEVNENVKFKPVCFYCLKPTTRKHLSINLHWQITKQRKNNLPFRPLGCSILEELRDILLDT
jgi:hypothetical protein